MRNAFASPRFAPRPVAPSTPLRLEPEFALHRFYRASSPSPTGPSPVHLNRGNK
jgi:hypothetical protein